MKINRLSLFGMVLAGLTVYAACRKIDYESSKEKEKTTPEEKFFNLHKATNPVVISLAAFMNRENERLHFVEQTVNQIGIPYWDKAMVTKGPSLTGRSSSDSVLFCFVPFVRDTQNFVNSFLELRVENQDTAYRYLCDWQYREMEYGSYATDSTAEYFAMFFMYFDNEMFGHERFDILDTALFNMGRRTI